MLLWPGVLMLITLGRGAAATVALAVTVVPVSWNADWPPDGLAADLGRSLYCVILLGYWVALLSSAPRSSMSAGPTDRESRDSGRRRWPWPSDRSRSAGRPARRRRDRVGRLVEGDRVGRPSSVTASVTRRR